MTTEVELSTAEIASQQGVTPKSINEWRRRVELASGTKLGTKRGKTWFFTAEEVRQILDAQSNDDRRSNPPQQIFEAMEEDLEAAEDEGFMVLATAQNDMVQQVKAVLTLAREEEERVSETIATLLTPQNRASRIMMGVARRLQGQRSDALGNVLGDALRVSPVAMLPDDSKRRICECL